MDSQTSSVERALIALFLFSGASGLIYEIVWLRMLIRAFGVTVYAVSTMLAVFMVGLAIGAALSGRRFRAGRDLLKTYALLELSIGAAAALSTLAISHLTGMPPWIRFPLAAATLLVPTILMGATLPVISGYLAARGEVIADRVGLLYGANTLGAVLGTLGAGFLLLGWIGELRTVLAGAAINVLVGILALLLARSGATASATEPSAARSALTRNGRLILLMYGASGFCALAYEVIWSRLLNLLLGNSVYAFSAMLGTYLAGVALGSAIVSRSIDRVRRPLVWFGALEVALAFLVLISVHVFVAIGVRESDPQYTFSQLWAADDFVWLFLKATAVVLPSTLALGALFPIAIHTLRDESDAPALVGRLYSANTVGAIAGSIATGFLLIPLAGTLLSLILAALLTLSIGLVVLHRSVSQRTLLLSGLGFALLVSFSFQDPFLTVLRARVPASDRLLTHEESKSSTVTVFETPSGSRDLYINGMYVASNSFAGRFMMHAPLLLHPSPRRAMIIGLGAGEAFVAARTHGVDTTVVDLAQPVAAAFPLFQPGREVMLHQPGAHLLINDGRNHLLSTTEKFDVVLVDGTPPIFASGVVNLYSKDFAELVRSRLSPDGIFVIWIPVYCFADDVWMIIRGFTDTFRHVRVWAEPGPTGVLLFGSDGDLDPAPSTLDERLRARGLDRSEPAFQLSQLLAGMSFSEAQIRARVSSVPPLTDDRPYVEFPLARFLSGAALEKTNAFVGEALR